jgi:hypothetical protein
MGKPEDIMANGAKPPIEATKLLELEPSSVSAYLQRGGKNTVRIELEKKFVVNSFELSIGVNVKEESIEKLTEKLREVINYVYKSENHVDLMAPSTLLDGYYRVFNSLTDDQTFLDTLEVDKEYFYRIKSVLSYPYQMIVYSKIHKIKVSKSGELYFLENEIVSSTQEPKKELQKSFSSKVFAEANYIIPDNIPGFKLTQNLISFGHIKEATNKTFNSSTNTSYLKFRIKSKKTNRKIDINLAYRFLNVVGETSILPKNVIQKYHKSQSKMIVLKQESFLKAKGYDDFYKHLKDQYDIVSELFNGHTSWKGVTKVKIKQELDSLITSLLQSDIHIEKPVKMVKVKQPHLIKVFGSTQILDLNELKLENIYSVIGGGELEGQALPKEFLVVNQGPQLQYSEDVVKLVGYEKLPDGGDGNICLYIFNNFLIQSEQK